MKRRVLSLFLAITLILTLCSGLSLTAAGMELSMGSVGENLTGVLDTTTGQLTISGYGDMDDWTNGSPPWNGMQSMIKSVVLPQGLTSIGGCAFDGCRNLPSITIPSGVTSIGNRAFRNCAILAEVTLPAGVTSIGRNAFEGCAAFTEMTIPDGVTRINAGTFKDCGALSSVTIPDNVTYIGESAFEGCAVLADAEIPESLRYLGDSAFRNCAVLTSVELPEGVTEVGTFAFSGCGALESVELPEGLTEICPAAFENCASLASVMIPESVLFIEEGAFEGCSALTSVYIPKNVRGVNFYAFARCDSLTEITVDPENEEYSSEDGLILSKTGGSIVQYPTGRPDSSFVIPTSIRFIDSYSFFGSPWLKSVFIPSTVVSIGEKALGWDRDPDGVSCVAVDGFVIYGYAGTAAQVYAEDNGFTFVALDAEPEYPGGDCGAEGDNLTWVFNTDTGLLSIEGSGAMANYRARTAPWYLYRTAITAVSLPENLTTVGSYAFWFCQSITEVTVPDSVTSLGNHAFASCYALRSVELSDSLTDIGTWTFSYDHALESVSIPNGLTRIGGSVFENCDGLTAVTIPNSVTDIDVCAFLSCKALSAVTIPDSVTSIGGSAFSNCDLLTGVWVPAGVSNISVSAFGSCDSLTAIDVDPQNRCYSSLNGVLFNKDQTDLIEYPAGKSASSYTVPSGVTTIKEWAFENCVYLTEVILPDSVTTLESLAFFFCDVLSTVTIGSGVTVIEDNAFFNCQGLSAIHVNEANDSFCSQDGVLFNKDKTELIKYPIAKPDSAYTIPYGVERIGAYAFAECGALTAVTIPDSVTEIGENAFQNCIGLTEAAIPGSVQIIGFEAFCDCYALASLTLSEGLQSIESAAFRGCNGLTNVTIPNSVTWLGDSAFSDCWSLTSVTIGSGITAIESSVFNNCAALTSVTIPASVTEIGDKALGWCCADGMSCEKIEGFTIYGCEGTVAQTYAEENGFRFCRLDAFGDVPANSYYAVPVAWAVANDITAGTGEHQFSPDMDCTRAQIMTFLWSAAGKPEPTRAESPFSDVPESAYYYKAVLWAVENGVTSGTGGGRFSPNAVCSRAQAVTFLWRAAGQPEPVGENPFEDVKPGDWYYESVLWAVENGITAGTSQNRFSPQMDCTRAQIVTFLYLDLAEAR